MSNSKTFKTPILTSIFYIFGTIVVVAGCIGAFGAFAAGNSEESRNVMGFSHLGVALLILLVTLITSLPLFGIGQVIEYIGKTAFHAELINESLTTDSYDMKKALGKVSDQLKKIADNQANIAVPSPSNTNTSTPLPMLTTTLTPKTSTRIPLIAPSITCPHCRERILESDLVDGMNTCPKCKRDFKVEC